LLAGRKLGDRFARDESFRAAYLMFDEHIRDAQKLVDKSIPPNSIRPKLMATSGAPGSGKSFLLDELSAFHPADVDKFALPASRAYFDASNLLALNVTFNSDTPFNEIFDKSAQQSLSLRILFQYVQFFTLSYILVAPFQYLTHAMYLFCSGIDLEQVFPVSPPDGFSRFLRCCETMWRLGSCIVPQICGRALLRTHAAARRCIVIVSWRGSPICALLRRRRADQAPVLR
jgi:hypothetical protein